MTVFDSSIEASPTSPTITAVMETQSPIRPLSPSPFQPAFDEFAETEHPSSQSRPTSPEPGVDRPSLTSWPIPSHTDTSAPPDQLPTKHSEHLYRPQQSTSQPDLSKHSNIRSGPRRSSDHVRTLSHVSERTDIVPFTVPVTDTTATPPPQSAVAITDTTPPPQATVHHDVALDSEQSQRRPHLFRKTSHMESDYVHMILALDDISIFYNIAAGFFTWILLAGFVLFPGTFPNLQAKAEQHKLPVNSPIVLDAITRVTSLPLFIVAWSCTGIGIIGMLWLTWRWRRNYIWALNKIFMTFRPGLLNSLAGLLSTLASIYGSQDGQITRPSRITLIVLVSCSGVCLILVAIYSLWLVRRMKNKHDKEVGLERAGKYGEGVTIDHSASMSKQKRRKMKQKEQV